MRSVRYSVAMSLDGYIAGAQGEYDWIPMDPDIDFAALTAQFDTAVMGRKTYDVTRQQGAAGAMPGLAAYVVSRTLRQEDCPGVIVTAEPAPLIAELKSRPGKDIWLFGGGELFRGLLELGLVDTVEVATVPILLGGGLPLLPTTPHRAQLRLTRHRVYEKSGIVALEYAVVR